MSSTTKRLLARRLLLPIALAAIGVAAGVAPASAAAPMHVQRTVGPIVVGAPAGVLCDFTYREQASYTQNLTQFFDDAGTLVRVEDHVDIVIQHSNIDSGLTLIEEDHYAAYVDFVSGVAKVTGQTWHLRDANGRLVLSGAGVVATDLVTGEVLWQTPHARADFQAPICAALANS